MSRLVAAIHVMACMNVACSSQIEDKEAVNPIRVAEEYGYYPSIVCNGSDYGLAWIGIPNSQSYIYFRSMNSSGFPTTDPIQLTTSMNTVSGIDMLWTGDRYAITWSEHFDRWIIHLVVLDTGGNILIPDMTVSDAILEEVDSSLAWNGAGYGLVWVDKRDYASGSSNSAEIYFTFVSSDGIETISDTRITMVDSYKEFPQIVWVGDSFLACWGDGRDEAVNVYCKRIGEDGVELSADSNVSNDPTSLGYPKLLWDDGDSDAMIFWFSAGDDYTSWISYARASRDGVKLSENTRINHNSDVWPTTLYNSEFYINEAYNVAWSDGTIWIVWYGGEHHTNDDKGSLFLKTITKNGATRNEETRITKKSSPDRGVSIAWDGMNATVAWGRNDHVFMSNITQCY